MPPKHKLDEKTTKVIQMCSINVLITVIRTDNTLKRINGISEPIKKKGTRHQLQIIQLVHHYDFFKVIFYYVRHT